MRKAVVRDTDGFVENIIEIEEGADWQPPEGCYLIDAGDGSPGDTWDGEKFVKPELPPPIPPLCTHWAVIDSINLGSEKPVRVKRTWEGMEYTVNCYATESVKDQYQAGNIVVGDYVMVEFLDDDPDRAVVFAKVFKTW